MSTNIRWRFAINTFEVNTKGSNVKMLTLSSDTHAKLKAEESNPVIAAILLVYEPVFFAYRALCEQYRVKSGEYEGKTLGFTHYLDELPQKLREWESLIRIVYLEDSPEEHEIFPNKRTPFLNDTYEKRLEALGSLKLKVAADPALATVSIQITSAYNAIMGARLVQQTSEGSLGQLSDLREDQRIILANELMGVLGSVMTLHKHALHHIERYFDLSLLYDRGAREDLMFNGTITGSSILNLNAEMDLGDFIPEPDTVFRIKNTSSNTAMFTVYGTNSPTAPPGPGIQFQVAQGETIEKTLTELGLVSATHFNMQNNTPFEGSWEIEILQ